VLRVGNLEPGTIGFVRKRIGAEKDIIVVKVMIATLMRIAGRYNDMNDNKDRPATRDHMTVEANRTLLENSYLEIEIIPDPLLVRLDLVVLFGLFNLLDVLGTDIFDLGVLA
jgi:hypothetical protein